ncbi:hypothetical protein CO038_04745 [Candidatus Pacearchaeota archaeon CG_4_9_14_0_2_um_filter_39_13]|nr:HAD-IA family hydrolase [Candidatus Pacearchaeota archaeon]PJC44265.1 MAG: hypothetical protein CO038_04745 [Candidatus Pacearchaeota archaeon CG_4_9_14_0_2_um_filter_39_13]
MKRIKTIIFDLNRVIVFPQNIDKEYLEELGVSQSNFWKASKQFMDDYAIGKITLEQFLRRLIKENGLDDGKLNKSMELHHKNLFVPEETSSLLESLQKNYKLILAAGDGKESLGIKLRKFDLHRYFEKIYATCDFGVTKKKEVFYKKILINEMIIPAETLFIDDQKEHINAAQKTGINVIHFKDIQRLRRDLKSKFNIRF